MGTPAILHARGREIARVRLKGNCTGTFPVMIRQAQSTLVLIIVFTTPQQSVVGELPLLLLPVMKFKHGVKLLMMEVVHGVDICPLTVITVTVSRAVRTLTRL